MKSYVKKLNLCIFILVFLFIAGCTEKEEGESELTPHLVNMYKKMNDFVADIYTLHKKRLEGREYYIEESVGGYGGLTNDLEFYREVKYFDKKTDKLLSDIKWEKKNPDKIHIIDVYIYDDNNRLIREYSASYHPSRRTSPVNTLISLHYYNKHYHSFREFDVFDINVYEQCNDVKNEENVLFANHYEDIPDSPEDMEENTRKTYQRCFAEAGNSAGRYATPMVKSNYKNTGTWN